MKYRVDFTERQLATFSKALDFAMHAIDDIAEFPGIDEAPYDRCRRVLEDLQCHLSLKSRPASEKA